MLASQPLLPTTSKLVSGCLAYATFISASFRMRTKFGSPEKRALRVIRPCRRIERDNPRPCTRGTDIERLTDWCSRMLLRFVDLRDQTVEHGVRIEALR